MANNSVYLLKSIKNYAIYLANKIKYKILFIIKNRKNTRYSFSILGFISGFSFIGLYISVSEEVNRGL